jgi:hypothetical protein
MTRYLPFYRYKKHLGLGVNVKNARVRARAEISGGRYNAIPLVCGDGNCYPRGVSDFQFTKSHGREMTEVFKYIGARG